MKSMLQTKSNDDLGCKFANAWECQLFCNTESDETGDAEKLAYLCRRLVELQKSNAVFKNCLIRLNLLQRGLGTSTLHTIITF